MTEPQSPPSEIDTMEKGPASQTVLTERRPVSSDPPLIDADELQIHRLYRERIVQEDNLINHRMMWLILSQAFMFALWAVLSKEADFKSFDTSVIRYALAAIGFVFATLGGASIAAARGEINRLEKNYLRLYPTSEEQSKTSGTSISHSSRRTDILPGVIGSGFFHLFGHGVDYSMPAGLACLWAVLAGRQAGIF